MRIVGWEDFQGYKKRGPQWIKLHLNLLDQPQYLGLPLVARAVMPALWITAARISEDGILPDDIGLLSTLSHVRESELVEALHPLCAAGFIQCDSFVAVPATRLAPQTETETERETEREVGRESVVVSSRPETARLPPRFPADIAEKATTDEIRRLQLDLGARLVRLSEHPKGSELMVPGWCRRVTSYDRKDGSKVGGISDFRTIQSIERLQKSIADADWWLAKLGPVEVSRGA